MISFQTANRITIGHRPVRTKVQTGDEIGGSENKGIMERWDRRTHRFTLVLFLPFALCFSLFVLDLPISQSRASDAIPQGGTDAKKTSKVSTKAKFSFGYDNNVSERKEDRIESRFYQFYISSGMCMLPTQRTLLSLKLQDGLKYLDAPSLSGESVLISNLDLFLSHRLSERLIPEIQGNLGGRTSIHSDSGTLPSEEAYLNGSLGAVLKAVLLSDINSRAFFHYRFINFEDFDPFDREGPLIGLRADVRLLPGATMSIQYSRERSRYSKWELISPDVATRTDTVNDITLFTQFYKYFLFDIAYSYQNSESDVDGYSYRANRLSVLMARSLPLDIMFQLYALVRSKKYRSAPDDPASTQIDLEDDERGVLTIKVSKDISKDSALEAQYDLRRGSSHEEDGLYTKSVFSLSLSFHF